MMEQENNNTILPENNNANMDIFNQENNVQPQNQSSDNYVVDSSMDNIINSASEMEMPNIGIDSLNSNSFSMDLNDINIANEQSIVDGMNGINLDNGFNQPSQEIVNNNQFDQTQVFDNNLFSDVSNVQNNLNVNEQLNNGQADNVSFGTPILETNPAQELNNNNIVTPNLEQPVPNNIVQEPVNIQNTDDVASDEEIKKFFKDFLIVAVIVIIIIILLPYVNKLIGF